MIHVDTNVLVDILHNDNRCRDRSVAALAEAVATTGAGISQAVYAELAVGIDDRAFLDMALSDCRVARLVMDDEALYLAGRAHAAYLKRGGPRMTILPDFFIGAHAQSSGAALLTREPRRYRTAFPELALVEP